MGGGSSDAATVLLAAADGLLGAMRNVDYLTLARSLGSDVPFFLAQTAALVEGTGERVTALGAPPDWHAVVIKPPVAVSTAWAYQELDKMPRESRARNTSVSLQLAETLQRADFAATLELLQNDFHDVIARENAQIRKCLDALHAAGALRPMLTGSGSCVFALVQTKSEREELMRRLQLAEGFEVFGCAFYRGAAWRSAA
jgi:4-diphosphocytidyl-2-C-methyl-D-erythritol kinase